MKTDPDAQTAPTTQQAPVMGYYEPSFSYTVLKGCSECGEPHPLARTPPAPDGQCPDCGTPSVTCESVVVLTPEQEAEIEQMKRELVEQQDDPFSHPGILEKIGSFFKNLNNNKGDK